MEIAVYRYIPTGEYYNINGWTYERQHKQWLETLKAVSITEAVSTYETDGFVLTFEEVKDQR
jgi:hypothetical protein